MHFPSKIQQSTLNFDEVGFPFPKFCIFTLALDVLVTFQLCLYAQNLVGNMNIHNPEQIDSSVVLNQPYNFAQLVYLVSRPDMWWDISAYKTL